MVYYRKCLNNSNIVPFNQGLLEDTGCGMVSSSSSMSHDSFHIRCPGYALTNKPYVSIVICTYGRPESLNDTLQSLTKQTFRNFEVILITQKGNLSELRDIGLKDSLGDIVSFIDDDVYCQPTWLQAVVEAFKKEGIVGVSGPTIIESRYQENRDSLKFRKLKRIQEWLFKVPSIPGTLSSCGAPSMASNFEGSYEGEVQYLECCNMSVKRKEAIDVGGFDPVFTKTSEWCELDLSFRLKQRGRLYYYPMVKLFHRPSRAGIYKERNKTKHRWDNFICFQKRWVRNSIRTYLYRGFVWCYLKMKDMRMI